MNLQINGSRIETSAYDITALVREQGLDPSVSGIAVAVNDMVVPRARWKEYELADGDSVEIITATQGG